MAKSKKVVIPKSVKGYGYAGVWASPKNTIGWLAPDFVAGKVDRRFPDINRDAEKHGKGQRFFLCEITIKPIKDKLGRPINKIIPS